jgi:hypothetical protein
MAARLPCGSASEFLLVGCAMNALPLGYKLSARGFVANYTRLNCGIYFHAGVTALPPVVSLKGHAQITLPSPPVSGFSCRPDASKSFSPRFFPGLL